MRKQWKGFILGVLVTTMVFTLAMPVAAAVRNLKADFLGIKITLDGRTLTPKDANGKVVEPFAVEGTTYLPLRAVAEALGLEVGWHGPTKTVQLNTNGGTQPPVATPTPQPPVTQDEYSIGQTWTVPGQWSLTITGVSEMTERNPYSDKNPAAVYLVDYTYTNLGYEDGFTDGLFWTLDNMIVDSAGVMGYGYPNTVTNHPNRVPVGATCIAHDVIGVDNAGDFKLTVSKYDGNDVKQKATFKVNVN